MQGTTTLRFLCEVFNDAFGIADCCVEMQEHKKKKSGV